MLDPKKIINLIFFKGKKKQLSQYWSNVLKVALTSNTWLTLKSPIFTVPERVTKRLSGLISPWIIFCICSQQNRNMTFNKEWEENIHHDMKNTDKVKAHTLAYHFLSSGKSYHLIFSIQFHASMCHNNMISTCQSYSNSKTLYQFSDTNTMDQNKLHLHLI